MTMKAIDESAIWKQFESEAKKRRRNPVKILGDYMKECLEIREHEGLDKEIRQEARKSS